MRIQKYLSWQGLASRREAEKLIKQGLVKLNGQIVREMGVQIDPMKDVVEFLSTKGQSRSDKITIAYHKPRGVISSRDSGEGETVFDLLPQFKKLNILGRLDKESEGLLLLSNDGVLAKKITGPIHETEKEYEVYVRENLSQTKIKALEQGMTLEDLPAGRQAVPRRTLPAQADLIDEHTFRIILREGRKHQIRRMCDHINLTVTRLIRLRIGKIKLGNLRPGEFKQLSGVPLPLGKTSEAQINIKQSRKQTNEKRSKNKTRWTKKD